VYACIKQREIDALRMRKHDAVKVRNTHTVKKYFLVK